MILSLDGTAAVGAFVGLLFVVLGVGAGAVRFGDKTNRGFALFAVAWGVENIVTNVHARSHGPFDAVSDPLDRAVQFIVIVLLIAAASGLASMARRFPDPLMRADRSDVTVAVVAGAYYVVFDFGLTVWAYRFLAAEGSTVLSLAGFAEIAAYGVLWGTMWGVLVLLALRYPAAGHRRPAFLLTSAALGVYPAYWLGWLFAEVASTPWYPGERSALLGLLPPALLVVGLWLRNTASAPGSGAAARRMAWFLLGAACVGMLVDVAGSEGLSRMGHRIASALSVFLLGYAIVRHQVLGIDIKLRWTISRGTLAALFLAAFFVVSEGAQLVFGADDPWLGVLGAGALVFAIAPLRRAAERLAAKAVPVVPAVGATASLPSESSFRKAVRLALRDSALSREEEGHLHELARDLGLDGARAHAIITETEREASP